MLFALKGPALLGVEPRWGAVGLSLASVAGALLEFALLRRALWQHVGETKLNGKYLLHVWSASFAALIGVLVIEKFFMLPSVFFRSLLFLVLYALLYLGTTYFAGLSEARAFVKHLRRNSAKTKTTKL